MKKEIKANQRLREAGRHAWQAIADAQSGRLVASPSAPATQQVQARPPHQIPEGEPISYFRTATSWTYVLAARMRTGNIGALNSHRGQRLLQGDEKNPSSSASTHRVQEQTSSMMAKNAGRAKERDHRKIGARWACTSLTRIHRPGHAALAAEGHCAGRGTRKAGQGNRVRRGYVRVRTRIWRGEDV